MSGLMYDEDGIDGPFEREMAKPVRSFRSKRPNASSEDGLEQTIGGYKHPSSGRWCKVKLDHRGNLIEWEYGWEEYWKGSTDSRAKALQFTRGELDFCQGCLDLCEPIAAADWYCDECEELDEAAQ